MKLVYGDNDIVFTVVEHEEYTKKYYCKFKYKSYFPIIDNVPLWPSSHIELYNLETNEYQYFVVTDSAYTDTNDPVLRGECVLQFLPGYN
jgi:hypothetical protein